MTAEQRRIADEIEREPARFLLRELAPHQRGARRGPPRLREAAATVAGSQAHSLIPYQSGVWGTVSDQRLNQTDLRLTKSFKFGQRKIEGNFDIYNLLNSRVPQAIITTYGSTFMRPSAILGGRLFKFGTQVDW